MPISKSKGLYMSDDNLESVPQVKVTGEDGDLGFKEKVNRAKPNSYIILIEFFFKIYKFWHVIKKKTTSQNRHF